jgi:hypothetical protein
MRKLRELGVSAILDYAAEADIRAEPPKAAKDLLQAGLHFFVYGALHHGCKHQRPEAVGRGTVGH